MTWMTRHIHHSMQNRLLPVILLALSLSPLVPGADSDPAPVQPAPAEPSPAETFASRVLRSQILPAEVQYQAGAYTDQDGNGIGEYGLFPEMSGMNTVVGGFTLQLLEPMYKAAEPVVFGYHFKIVLPASQTTALSSAADGKRPLLDATKDLAAIYLQCQHWICYAWPVDGKGLVFAINQTGNVYSRPSGPKPPEWNDLMANGDWKAPVSLSAWTMVSVHH